MTNLLMLLFFFIFTYNSIIHDGYFGTKRLLQKIENKNWNYFIKISSKINIKNSVILILKHFCRGHSKQQICNKMYQKKS